MTNPNSAAQAPEQDDITQRVLTDDEIEALAKKHIAPHADRLDAILPTRVPYQQTEQFRRVKALIGDVLSKLRAPVAPEPFRAAFANGVLPATRFHELWESAAPSKNSGHTMMEDLTWQVGKFAALVAAEVRAPIADERSAVDPCGYVAVKVSAVDWLKNKFPALTIKAGLCERIGGRLYTITRLMRDHDAALASDPVAGEAVYTLRVRGAIQAWTPTTAAFSIPDGEHQLFLSPAAPQATAEAFDFVAHLARQAEFSARTFGPGARVAGVCDHIRKELIESETSGGDLKEWVDVIILGLDGAWRSGATPQEIIAAIVAKQAKNEARTWPDWRTVDPTKAIEHDRGGQP